VQKSGGGGGGGAENEELEIASVVLKEDAIHWPFVGASSSSWKAHHGGPVKVLTAHPDERLLLSSGKDASVRIWAPEGGTSCVAIYKGHREAVTHMSVVVGREWVCSSDGEMHIFDLETQHRVHCVRGILASGYVGSFTSSLALSPLKCSPSAGGMVMVGSTAKYPGPVTIKVLQCGAVWCSVLQCVTIKVVDLRSVSRAPLCNTL